jgi:hypothetical protein
MYMYIYLFIGLIPLLGETLEMKNVHPLFKRVVGECLVEMGDELTRVDAVQAAIGENRVAGLLGRQGSMNSLDTSATSQVSIKCTCTFIYLNVCVFVFVCLNMHKYVYIYICMYICVCNQ